MTRFILASRSTARSGLLCAAGLEFEAVSAELDEAMVKRDMLAQGATPAAIAGQLAVAKALSVSRGHDGLVIGADQTLELEGQLFDKPTDHADARRQLLALRGRTHQLHSAVAAAIAGDIVWRSVVTAQLSMRHYSDAFLDSYIQRNGEALLDCVGGYQLEKEGVQLFNRIDGDYFAILGLPMIELLSFLRERGHAPC